MLYPAVPTKSSLHRTHLSSLSSLTPSPASPVQSVSSVSAATRANAPPTAQQILTATLLFTLLTAPNHSLSLNKVKEVLTAKASTSGSAAMVSGHSRILYGCVAKRLLKIERGSGEQIVKFDIWCFWLRYYDMTFVNTCWLLGRRSIFSISCWNKFAQWHVVNNCNDLFIVARKQKPVHKPSSIFLISYFSESNLRLRVSFFKLSWSQGGIRQFYEIKNYSYHGESGEQISNECRYP